MRTHVPKAQIESGDQKAVHANVGAPDVDVMITLLKELHENREQLFLDGLTVSVCALEDVLRKVELDPEDDNQMHSESSGLQDRPCALIDANGAGAVKRKPRLIQRLRALLLKKVQYNRRDCRLPFLMVLLPLSVSKRPFLVLK